MSESLEWKMRSLIAYLVMIISAILAVINIYVSNNPPETKTIQPEHPRNEAVRD